VQKAEVEREADGVWMLNLHCRTNHWAEVAAKAAAAGAARSVKLHVDFGGQDQDGAEAQRTPAEAAEAAFTRFVPSRGRAAAGDGPNLLVLVDNGSWLPVLRRPGDPALERRRAAARHRKSKEWWGGLFEGGCWLHAELRLALAALSQGGAFRARFGARLQGNELGVLVGDDVMARIDGRLKEAHAKLGECVPDHEKWKAALKRHHRHMQDTGLMCA
jgi:hypothetical protein